MSDFVIPVVVGRIPNARLPNRRILARDFVGHHGPPERRREGKRPRRGNFIRGLLIEDFELGADSGVGGFEHGKFRPQSYDGPACSSIPETGSAKVSVLRTAVTWHGATRHENGTYQGR